MPKDRLDREQDAFLERHYKSADLLVFDTRLGHCMEAIYYSPMKKANDARESHIKEFFRSVRENVVGEQYEYEQSQLHQDFRDELAGERYNDTPNNPGADLE